MFFHDFFPFPAAASPANQSIKPTINQPNQPTKLIHQSINPSTHQIKSNQIKSNQIKSNQNKSTKSINQSINLTNPLQHRTPPSPRSRLNKGKTDKRDKIAEYKQTRTAAHGHAWNGAERKRVFRTRRRIDKGSGRTECEGMGL